MDEETVWCVPMDKIHSPSRRSKSRSTEGDWQSRSRRTHQTNLHSSQIMDPIIQWNCRGFKINFI